MINHSSSVRLLEYISVSSLFYFLHYKKRYQIGSIELVYLIKDKRLKKNSDQIAD
jgi:hypothetical protein